MAFKREHMDDFIDLFRTFEIKKREILPTTSRKVTFRLPPSLTETVLKEAGNSFEKAVLHSKYNDNVTFTSGKLQVEANTARSFFKKSIESIISHILSLIKDQPAYDCSAIVMVGGFSESKLLYDAIQKAFPTITIIIPDGAGLAVLKGAVIYGHKPLTIAERICKFTYGKKTSHHSSPKCKHPKCKTFTDTEGALFCCDIFDKHVTIGQTVKLGEEQKESISYPREADQTSIGFRMYVSTTPNPALVTEPGCAQIGFLRIEIPDTSLGKEREFGTKYIFGGTEIAVKIEDKATGEVYITAVDFLE